jgi:hypothetical protein
MLEDPKLFERLFREEEALVLVWLLDTAGFSPRFPT